MGVGSDVRRVGRFVEACEAAGATVHAVEFGSMKQRSDLTATIDLTLSASTHHDAIEPSAVEFGSDGRLRLTVESIASIGPSTDHDLDVVATDATIETDGVRLEFTVSVPAEGDPAVGAGEEDGSVAVETDERESESTASDGRLDSEVSTDSNRERDVPPFEDPELLASVYDSCETFAEMAESIEMDVTAETVRRYMIDYEIHDPAPYGTDSESDADSKPDADSSAAQADDDTTPSEADTHPDDRSLTEPEPIVLTDGVGLPEDVTVESLVETVSRSNTIYEVRRDLGIARDDTVDLLEQLELVDLVVGRVSTEHERSIDRAGIVDRLREV